MSSGVLFASPGSVELRCSRTVRTHRATDTAMISIGRKKMPLLHTALLLCSLPRLLLERESVYITPRVSMRPALSAGWLAWHVQALALAWLSRVSIAAFVISDPAVQSRLSGSWLLPAEAAWLVSSGVLNERCMLVWLASSWLLVACACLSLGHQLAVALHDQIN